MTQMSCNSSHFVDLLEKLRSRQALIGIVGLGYVGLPLSLTFVEAGYRVLGLDIDPTKADAINQGHTEAARLLIEAGANIDIYNRLAVPEFLTHLEKPSKSGVILENYIKLLCTNTAQAHQLHLKNFFQGVLELFN
mgnify:CR=1 FL=1